MLFLLKPSETRIRSLLAERKAMTYSYPHAGATRSTPPVRWRINDMQLRVGQGRAKCDVLVNALFSWKLLAVRGLQVFASTDTIEPGTDVAILSRHFGIWSVDFCRVIYVLRDEPEQNSAVLRTGFAYGTLPGHAVRGEERFSVEWHPATEEVCYEIYSFSLPANSLIKLLSPIARATQLRFARASLEEAARLASQSEK
jgi:uncharacterized protein (UPF0548 family)